MTHLWRQTSMAGMRMLEFVADIFSFAVLANFPRYLSLDNPRIWTLSHNTKVPGLEPGEFFTGMPWDNCNLADSAATANEKDKKGVWVPKV